MDMNPQQQPQTPQPAPTPPITPIAPMPPFPQPTPELTPPVAAVTPRKSRKKWFIIGGAALILLFALLGVGLKVTADSSAKHYTDAVKTHLDTVFAETSRTKRIELLEKPAALTLVPLGSLLSEPYKYASETVKPAYDTTVKLSHDSIKASKAYNEDLGDLIKDIQSALAISTESIKADGSKPSDTDFDAIESELKASLQVADLLDKAADKAAGLEVLDRAGNRETIVKDLHDWATVRREYVAIAIAYFDSIIGWSSESLENISNNVPVDEYKDQANYQALLDKNVADYKIVTDKTVDDLTTAVDTLQSAGYSSEVQAQLDEANKHLDDLDVILEKVK